VYIHGSVAYGKGVGAHHGKILGKKIFNGVGGGQNSYQCHDPERDDKNGKDRPEQVTPY
jgi:hypothetical protein